jgi:hypothetical protein
MFLVWLHNVHICLKHVTAVIICIVMGNPLVLSDSCVISESSIWRITFMINSMESCL